MICKSNFNSLISIMINSKCLIHLWVWLTSFIFPFSFVFFNSISKVCKTLEQRQKSAHLTLVPHKFEGCVNMLLKTFYFHPPHCLTFIICSTCCLVVELPSFIYRRITVVSMSTQRMTLPTIIKVSLHASVGWLGCLLA